MNRNYNQFYEDPDYDYYSFPKNYPPCENLDPTKSLYEQLQTFQSGKFKKLTIQGELQLVTIYDITKSFDFDEFRKIYYEARFSLTAVVFWKNNIETLLWKKNIHKHSSEHIKNVIKTILKLNLKNENGKGKFLQTYFYMLPKEILIQIFQYLPMVKLH